MNKDFLSEKFDDQCKKDSSFIEMFGGKKPTKAQLVKLVYWCVSCLFNSLIANCLSGDNKTKKSVGQVKFTGLDKDGAKPVGYGLFKLKHVKARKGRPPRS
jgi:hypothetical protein